MACASARAMFLYGGQTLLVACGDIFPQPGEVFRRASPWQRGRTNPFRHFALRNATSPEGGGLGKEGRFRPHRLLARKSLPLSCKLFALAKASPFRERWHGEAVTERVDFRNEPSQSRCARQLPRRWSPWQRGQVSSSPVTGQKEPAVKLQTFRLCQSLSLSGEVARRSRDGEGPAPPYSCFRQAIFPWPSGASLLP